MPDHNTNKPQPSPETARVPADRPTPMREAPSPSGDPLTDAASHRRDTRIPLADHGAGDGAALDPKAEEQLWIGRTSWKHFIGQFVLWVGGSIIFGIILSRVSGGPETPSAWFSVRQALIIWGVVFGVAGLLVCGNVFIRIYSRRYKLTTQRLFLEMGLLNITIDHTELIRVVDVQIRKTLINRMLGLGTVTVMSSDASHPRVAIEGIADPEVVAEHIRSRVRIMRNKARSAYIESIDANGGEIL